MTFTHAMQSCILHVVHAHGYMGVRVRWVLAHVYAYALTARPTNQPTNNPSHAAKPLCLQVACCQRRSSKLSK